MANTTKNGTTIPSKEPIVKPFSKLPVNIIIKKSFGDMELARRSLEKFKLNIFAIKNPSKKLKNNPDNITIKTIFKFSALKNNAKKKKEKKLLIKKPINI